MIKADYQVLQTKIGTTAADQLLHLCLIPG